MSAAGYRGTVAPNSLAALFGTGISAVTASAQLDGNGQLPTQLAGVSVEMNGQASPLIFLSPTQINFLVPAKVGTGMVNVVVRSTGTNSTKQGTVDVENDAPALFSLDSSGTGPGAILNAVTTSASPFLVETQQNSGDDKRTRLAMYATGLRYAGNPNQDASITNVASSVQAQGATASGNLQLPVEYAGPAPGFFGLDQVNIVLPPEADGAGTVSVTLTAGSVNSNTVTFAVASLPASQIGVTGLTLSQPAVIGIGDVNATVSLNAVARLGGMSVKLNSNNGSVQIPSSISISRGQASAQFTIHANAVQTRQNATITASANGSTATATLELDPANTPGVAGLTFDPNPAGGGVPVSANLLLTRAAPIDGASVQITSDSAAAKVPATVTVPSGQTSANFTITTAAVTSPQTATIAATYFSSSQQARLTLNPAISVTLSMDTVLGGNNVTGTATLANPAPNGGANVSIQTSDMTAAQPAAFVLVPSGQTSAQFTIRTLAVSSARTVTITVSYNNQRGSASLVVNPPGSVTIASLALNPTIIQGGMSATGTVTLTDIAPITGIAVSLTSSSGAARPPVSVTVPPGQSSVSFTITTIHPISTQNVTITATVGNVSKTATLMVQ